ncbi:hypothetical protein AVEN_157933-1 [Araneus ventricosus]|uniref:Uncharacterized protein n=1 Tax=Araneus ventricosus TaxID=182803 RepID=A0A4Y2H881_ARAVE|nr:hypothetical protein AVEN_157933-1 [Araneus ventricosus]
MLGHECSSILLELDYRLDIPRTTKGAHVYSHGVDWTVAGWKPNSIKDLPLMRAWCAHGPNVNGSGVKIQREGASLGFGIVI